MDDAKKDWQKTHDEISQKSSLLESLLDMHGDIVINVDNTGKIVYINEKALLFFGIKGRLMINEPAMQLIQDDPEAYPVFIVNLFDASKQKTEPPKLVQIKTKKSQMRNFQAMFKKNEEKGKIFYSLILREVKE
jgi:transcriptional regulator with PAS, ATPase and Fis domain